MGKGASLLLLTLAGLATVSGCAPATPAVTVVTGVVYFTDSPASSEAKTGTGVVSKPISGAKVTFHDQGSPVGYGITDTLGRFRIRYYPKSAGSVDGLPLGVYAVTITKLSLVEKRPAGEGEPAQPDGENLLPERYSHLATTEWQEIQVTSDQAAQNHFELAVRK